MRIVIVFRLGYLETRANKGSYTYSYCFSAWIFGNRCEIRIIYVLLLFLGLDIWKPVRTKDLILILIDSAWIFGNPYELRFLYVLLLFLGLDIWKPVRN